jgi:hypothetical protein
VVVVAVVVDLVAEFEYALGGGRFGECGHGLIIAVFGEDWGRGDMDLGGCQRPSSDLERATLSMVMLRASG